MLGAYFSLLHIYFYNFEDGQFQVLIMTVLQNTKCD